MTTEGLIFPSRTILGSVAHPGRFNAFPVEALELEFFANLGLGFVRCGSRARFGYAAAQFIGIVTAVVYAVALPPVGHAFFVVTQEHPVVARVSRKVRRRWGSWKSFR